MSKQITGRAYVRVDGKQYPSRDGAVLKPGMVSRKPVVGADGVHGYVEKVLSPSIECSLSHNKELSIEELQNIVGATIMFETDTGPIYILREAWCDPESLDLTVGDGEVKVTFNGVAVEEVSG